MFNKRKEIISKLYDHIIEYSEFISDELARFNPDYYSKYYDAIKNFTADLVGDIPQVYEIIANIENSIDIVKYVINNDTINRRVRESRTQTSINKIELLKTKIKRLCDKLMVISAEEDDVIFNDLLNKIPKDKLTEYIYENTQGNPNRYKLWLLSLSSDLKGGQLDIISRHIDNIKDDALGSNKIKLTAPGVQGMIKRYRLYAISSYLNVNDLFNEFGLQYNDDHDDKTNILSQPCVVINKSSASCVEFDIRGLIDKQYITKRSLNVTDKEGLSEKKITKYDTAKMLTVHDSYSDKKIINTLGEQQVYVFETINGKQYRLLSCDGQPKVDINSIDGLVNDFRCLPEKYNLLHEENILTKCFDNKSKHIIKDFENITYKHTDIKHKILHRLTKRFNALSDDINSVSDFFTFIVDTTPIYDTLTSILTQQHTGSEYNLSYLVKFDRISFLLMDETKKRTKHIDNKIFDLSAKDKNIQLMNAYKNALADALDEMDKTGVWSNYEMSLKEYYIKKSVY